MSYIIRAFEPNSELYAERNSATPYAFGVYVQSTVKGYEGTWIFCGFASTLKRAEALARKEGGVVVSTVITAA